MTTLICFSRPYRWWGWLIAYYQLMRGVKYWQVTHCEVLSEGGVFAYRINETLHGTPAHFPPGRTIAFPIDYDILLIRSLGIHRLWGDFSPFSILNGRNCALYVCFLLNFRSTYLPGQLLESLQDELLRDSNSRE